MPSIDQLNLEISQLKDRLERENDRLDESRVDLDNYRDEVNSLKKKLNNPQDPLVHVNDEVSKAADKLLKDRKEAADKVKKQIDQVNKVHKELQDKINERTKVQQQQNQSSSGSSTPSTGTPATNNNAAPAGNQGNQGNAGDFLPPACYTRSSCPQCKSFEAKGKSLCDEYQIAKNKTEGLKAQKDSLLQQLKTKTAQRDALKNNNKDLDDGNKALAAGRDILANGMAGGRSLTSQEKADLERNLNDYQKQKDDINDRSNKLGEQIRDLNVKIDNLSRQISNAFDAQAEFPTKIRAANTATENCNKTCGGEQPKVIAGSSGSGASGASNIASSDSPTINASIPVDDGSFDQISSPPLAEDGTSSFADFPAGSGGSENKEPDLPPANTPNIVASPSSSVASNPINVPIPTIVGFFPGGSEGDVSNIDVGLGSTS